jgi:hypothetical protein
VKYENFKLCPDLKAKEICLVAEQYSEGIFTRVYHQHVPRHRLSEGARHNLLRTLVVKLAGMHPDHIVSCFLNNRGKKPSAERLVGAVSYPEPGVIRHYVGGNTKAWSDMVISASKFRKPKASKVR